MNNAQAVTDSFPAVAKWLGYSGVIPFVVLALGIVSGINFDAYGISNATGKLLIYAAVIVSFIGAVHWGVALGVAREHQNALFLYSVLPALFAWLWTFLAVKLALLGMALTIAAMYFIDRQLLTRHVPPAYLTMRLHLTLVVGISLLLASMRAL